MILFDTDHLTIFKFPDSPKYIELHARLESANDPNIGTTVISLEEQLRGWLAVIARHQQVRKQVNAYQELLDLFEFFGRLTMLPFDDRAAEEYDRQRQQGVRIAAMDLKIASIALTHDALLLSANLRDFTKVPTLKIENWIG